MTNEEYKETMELVEKLEKRGFGIVFPDRWPPRYPCNNLWKDACEHDGVDPSSMFVVFSDDNPHMKD